ncbi:uncharacterized protein LOC122507376 isoform X2 [Leptopilina heterotoma]|uniref:uncharacterized protein LOC122507376 isoform X2 n=1 Tax=Leptopilina heterotoma TaxID=63436 RepID=UPI001CA91EDE|nr:uncharacterized protein LOC122507376 isoform X2 [Leptopilina heterotoma]
MNKIIVCVYQLRYPSSTVFKITRYSWYERATNLWSTTTIRCVARINATAITKKLIVSEEDAVMKSKIGPTPTLIVKGANLYDERSQCYVYIENQNLIKTTVFGVADYKYVVRFSKFKIADSINPQEISSK